MKFIIIRTLLLVTYAIKILLLPIDSQEKYSLNDEFSLENQQIVVSNAKSRKNDILYKFKSGLIIHKAKDGLNFSNPEKQKIFNLNGMIINLDFSLKLLSEIKEKTISNLFSNFLIYPIRSNYLKAKKFSVNNLITCF